MAPDEQDAPMEDVPLDGADASPPAQQQQPPAAVKAAAAAQPKQPQPSKAVDEPAAVEEHEDAAPPPPPPKEDVAAEPIAPLGTEVVASSSSTEAASAPLPPPPPPDAGDAGPAPPSEPPAPAPEAARPLPSSRTDSVSSDASGRPVPGRAPSSAASLDRTRTGSTSTISSLPHSASLHHSRGSLSTLPATTLSSIHLVTALNSIGASKEARRSPPLQTAIAAALEALKEAENKSDPIDQALILEPLRLACETRSAVLQSTALDCISKLVSHSFFHAGPVSALPSDDAAASPEVPQAQDTVTVSDHLVAIITSTYTEATPDAVALQIVKSLLALVLSPSTPVHHSSLLKAVRTVYNIFLLSADSVNQMVAQGGLTQMVHHVFGRVKVEAGQLGVDAARGLAHSRKDSSATISTLNGAGATSGRSTPAGLGISTVSLGLEGDGPQDRAATPIVQDRELQEGLRQPTGDEAAGAPPPIDRTEGVTSPLGHSNPPNIILSSEATVPQPPSRTQTPAPRKNGDGAEDDDHMPLTEQEMFVKDAFLVFRALCKLTMKPLMTDSDKDIKSEAMRSKLLSLHLILTILQSHVGLFASPYILIPSSSPVRATFVQATKQYLCLSLSRNAVSPVGQVFELCVEIFWNVLKGLRGKMKKEIEVLLNEIFLPILEMRTSTIKQKSLILNVFFRLSQDPQALVEIYLNYDCDRTAVGNLYERLVEIIAKVGSTHFAPSASGKEEVTGVGGVGRNEGGRAGAFDKGPVIPPSLTTSAMSGTTPSLGSLAPSGGAAGNESTASLPSQHISGHAALWANLPPEIKLRRQALECLVTILRSLVQWGIVAPRGNVSESESRRDSEDQRRESTVEGPEGGARSGGRATPAQVGPLGGPAREDDPETFETAKQRKTTLMEGIKKFNTNPKKGIKFLLEQGFVKSAAPEDVARFLLKTEGLSKAVIGEYMGEGADANIAIMHAFIDMLDFRNMKFVEAVRTFLQSFRLPGEAQKIDRYVLKFAERYIAGNPGTTFANADTAYILAFSVIMLNTDAHSKNIKTRRMTKEEFFKNNKGINDGASLPDDFLGEVYDEIQSNEIKMKDEIQEPQVAVTPGLVGTLSNARRDLQREAYVLQSEGMSNRTEALFKTLLRTQRRAGDKSSEQYYSASHLEHVRPMFEVAWMPFLAALSGPLQETDELDVVELCLEGFKHAIKIVCFFELELERNAFVSTLAKFTFLNNLGEMKTKNVEAIKTLLDIAVAEGNLLKKSWIDVLRCVSQLERMQLISNGIETPDLRRSSVSSRKTQGSRNSRHGPGEDVALESRSAQVTVASDMVFSSTRHLSGSAIVEFVEALSAVSWEEIQSSSGSDHPRLFSLQKLVEISYYNMARIRLEWSGIWQILGEHFNQVCCHNNPHVSFFALDALRQLAMRFLEKEELSHFQFQKDFLKPFEYTMLHNTNSDARDMVLQCLQQMIQARSDNLRSGWRTMFGVFSAASKVLTERVASYAFDLVTRIFRDHFARVVRFGAFADLTVCITDFCKVSKYQKISLQAIEMLRSVVPAMLACPDCPLSEPSPSSPAPSTEIPLVNDPMVKFWFPVLFSYYDVIMNGEDLEVRRLALDSLFTTLKTYGATFRPDFWDSVCQEVLFPIFAPLRSGHMAEEELWISTTMVTALRSLVDLYTFYFETLARLLDPLLELLCFCIDQENDTLARIGTTCFQQLLEKNVRKLSVEKWERIVSAFVQLFQSTLAHMLFDPNLRSEKEPLESPAYLTAASPSPAVNGQSNGTTTPPSEEQVVGMAITDRRRVFRQIIRKCVLQLLLIETTHELLQNPEVYATIPSEHLLRFLAVLEDSYQFARRFNADKDLRMALWKVGFMKQLPNLLKQESSSASTLVNNLLRMYEDPRSDRQTSRASVLERFVPLSLNILHDFNALDAESQVRHIAAWSPVICEILGGYGGFDDETFAAHLSTLYPLLTDALGRENAPEVMDALRRTFVKIGRVKGIVQG